MRALSTRFPHLLVTDPPVQFVDGVAEVTPEQAEALRAFAVHGVVVDGDGPVDEPEDEPDMPPAGSTSSTTTGGTAEVDDEDNVDGLGEDVGTPAGATTGTGEEHEADDDQADPTSGDVGTARPDGRASREAWAAYAVSTGVEVPKGATKAEIRTAVDSHES